MVYRNDIDALEARIVALDAELEERTHERDEVGKLLADARARAHVMSVLADRMAGGPQRRRRRLTVAASALALVAGLVTYGATRPDPADEIARSIDRFGKFTSEMCQCNDATCAKHVSDELTRWAEDMAKHAPAKPPTFDAKSQQQMTELAKRYADCMIKVMGTGDPARP